MCQYRLKPGNIEAFKRSDQQTPNDRELLELAAKAAGFLNWTWRGESLFVETGHSRGDTGFHWNPLTDDGDALRLAVKLKMTVDTNWWNYDQCEFSDTTFVSTTKTFEEQHKGDPYAATRRAIVRAAAAIGKAMP